ncbi:MULTISPECIES: acyl-CoA dehydrogenase family protein [unclassified Pseudovibrio]|uniref:acyl-CoA dehydrogenase family protein n=1 Tax=unclassified Pseudovibrio TaxID=2627060 RepID=UPI0007AEBA41|nr:MULTISPECIES: acyl-CoA dehydrogenase family protein [unclassified Pseudovibrio]KZL24606.1 Acyl-CoA dehydrogenase [Pseudovibrio sp. Ad37]KZL24632.1 Acyl-CoA dehydrogenase [Pseudovibrio sp. WM33]
MDFAPKPEQQERNAHLERFAQEIARSTTAGDNFDHVLWRQLCEIGLAGLPIPQDYGGTGLSALETIQSFETVARHIGDLGLLFSLSAHLFACVIPVWYGGSDDIKQRWLGLLAQGDLIAANAVSEENAGSDVFSMITSAKPCGDHYVLNGAKRFITNAPIADVLITYARTDSSSSFFGLSCFLIPSDTPGIIITPEQPKAGLTSSPWGSVYFDDCRVDQSLRVGAEGSGATLFHKSMIWERCCLFSIYIGAMERIYQLCLEHARTRMQFGRKIGENQAISDRIVNMSVRIETARLLLYKSAWQYDQGQPCEQTTALSKIWISESAVKIGEDAVQIFGGEAMIRGHPVNRFINDALPSRIFSGSSEIQREIVARAMKLR